MSVREQIILIGSGGHCRSVIDVIEAQGEYVIAGIVDRPENVGKKIFGYPVLATDEDIEKLLTQFQNYTIAIGHIKSNGLRKKLFERIKKSGGKFPVVQSPLAHVSTHSQIGEGTVVFHQAVINAGAVIGVNCIVNTASVVEHDVTVGDHCHIAPKAIINGNCSIGTDCFIGSNAVLIQGININEGAMISAGAVVIGDVPASVMMAGNPATERKKL